MKKLFIIFFIICVVSLSLNAFSKLKKIESYGDKSIKKQSAPVTGVSKLFAEQQDAINNALSDALAKISFLNGVEVLGNIKSITQEIDKNGNISHLQDISSNTELISKVFFQSFNISFYTEKYLKKNTKTYYYKSWCYIPYNETIFKQFVAKLKNGFIAENKVLIEQTNDDKNLITKLKSLLKLYNKLSETQQKYKKFFTVPNDFLNFLNNKKEIVKNDISKILFKIKVTKIPTNNLNKFVFQFIYEDKNYDFPYKVTVISGKTKIDSIFTLKKDNYNEIIIKPRKSGEVIIRIIPFNDDLKKYDGPIINFDFLLHLKKKSKFSNKIIGLSVLYGDRYIDSAASLFGNIITDNLEGSIELLKDSQDLISQAKNKNCDYLISIKINMLSHRYNPKQNIYIFFPEANMKIYDIKKNVIIYQNKYPNDKITDIRGIAPTRNAAFKQAISLKYLFENKNFKNEITNLK